MKSNSQIRFEAHQIMQNNWLVGVAIAFVDIMATASVNGLNSTKSAFLTMIAAVLMILVLSPLSVGVKFAFLDLGKNRGRLNFESIFSAFNNTYYWKAALLKLLKSFYILLWSLLFVIPGIIKSYAYSMAPYILAENPNISPDEALRQSEQMMNGHKMKLFKMTLVFLGLAVLSLLALGIPLLFLYPYTETTYAQFYLELRNQQPQEA